MSKPLEPGIRLRVDKFKQRCFERDPDKGTSAGRAEIIGMSRPAVARVLQQTYPPGTTFIAATLLAFKDDYASLGSVFDDLFEVVPATAQRHDVPEAA